MIFTQRSENEVYISISKYIQMQILAGKMIIKHTIFRLMYENRDFNQEMAILVVKPVELKHVEPLVILDNDNA